MIEPHQPVHIYTVTDLTQKIKGLLEKEFPFVWIRAEISNFRVPASGHFYFTLKDEHARIRAVMFRSQSRMLKFVPEDGMGILGLGRIGLYPPRGEYQIIIEHLEPEGVGALQIAFEQLKEKLALEGLFDERHKKPLPFLPRRISVVTSPTGAVFYDILHVLNRRFPNLNIDILPVKVQGDDASLEIADALDLLNRRAKSDVIIVARGGGSLEDLWPFNTETVARAIFESKIPVISAIGHETDFTISDMVADVRAPTPSAAAEIVVPVKEDLVLRCDEMAIALISAVRHRIDETRVSLRMLRKRLVSPRRTLPNQTERLSETRSRMQRAMQHLLSSRWHQLEMFTASLNTKNPVRSLGEYKVMVEKLEIQNRMRTMSTLNALRGRLKGLTSQLRALDPAAILERGYSVTLSRETGKVVTSARAVDIGQELEIVLARGALTARTTRRESTGSLFRRPTNGKG